MAMSRDQDYNVDEYMSNIEDGLLPDHMFDEDFDLAEIAQERVEYYNFHSECSNLVRNCMTTVLLQSLESIRTLLICCLLFRLAISVMHAVFPRVSPRICGILHLFGIFLGFVSLISIESSNIVTTVLIMLSYIFASYTLTLVLSTSSYSCSKLISIFTAVFLISGEYFVHDSELWHQIRGILLLLAMKVISVAFDIDSKSITTFPSILSYVSFCMHCGTLLFGPWVTFDDFSDSILCPKGFSKSWFGNILKSLICSFVCLLLSTCVLSYLFIDGAQPDLPSLTPFVANHWMASYQSAISFHFSHFYICFLSQTTCMISGIGRAGRGNSTWSSFVVVRPFSVLLPFSMLNLVVDWNIPMSKWLKKYVFNAYKHLGRTTAILLTYTASAILHGLSFHLASVLMSLSLITYVEYVLRKKISHLTKCPHIQSRLPVDAVNHSRPWWAVPFNMCWVAINIAHLAYLGSMFQSEDPEIAKQGYHMQHTVAKWRNLGFFSPIFAFICLILSLILPSPYKNVRTSDKMK